MQVKSQEKIMQLVTRPDGAGDHQLTLEGDQKKQRIRRMPGGLMEGFGPQGSGRLAASRSSGWTFDEPERSAGD